MKKNILVITFCMIAIPMSTALYSIGSNDSKEYASKGTIEIGGSINMSYASYRSVSNDTGYIDAQANIFPYFTYFLVDNFHIGGGPGLSLSYWAYEYGTPSVRRTFMLAPGLTFGYTVPITHSLFFDITLTSGFSYTVASNFFNEGFNDKIVLALAPGVKWNVGRGLIACGLSVGYAKNGPTGYDRVQIGLSTAFSVYF